MARMDAMTMKMDAQYKYFQSHSKQSNLDDDDIPMSREQEDKFMQTFRYNPNDQQNDSETPINFDSDDEDDEPTPQPKSKTPKPVKETPIPKPYKPKFPYPQRLRKEKMEAQYGKFLNMIRAVRINVPLVGVLAGCDESSAILQNKVPPKLGDPRSFLIPFKQKKLNLEVRTERMIFHIDSVMKHYYSNDDTCFSIDNIDEILEDDFDALLDAEPPTDLELKPLPDNMEYVFLKEPSILPIIISSQLSEENKNKLVSILKRHKQAFAWKTTDIPGICPSFCKHKIQLLEDKKPVLQKQRGLNPNMQEVIKKEIVKLLDTSIIYLIADSPWVSPINCVPKKGGITVVTNERNELVPKRTVTG
ncbi:hypothetical protein Tco_1329382 [Tanacetum coccineum]